MSSGTNSHTDLQPPIKGVGLSNPRVGQRRRRMLDLVNKLQSTGVQVDIDLPQIAVIGAQSAGKSSLIESISGISLPRASGTCTRCPTECRLSRSTGPWQCIVSLRFTTDSRGQPLGQAHNQQFGPIIYDKSQVEDRIRRAQKAILNPSKPTNFFLEGDESVMNMKEVTFSTNCVSLQISGPDVADLSFCDLPGLIASVSSNGSNADIELVRRVIINYIKKPSCIILLTVACETDFENQGAHHLAKEHDPKGRRTIGVLTKPDRIPIGEEYDWIPYIRNEKESLDNNWFCVKQPSTEELKRIKSWDEARSLEDDWFASTSPWCDLDNIYQKYLRTTNLVERLSNVLSDLIAKRLPEIREELDSAIAKTQAEKAKLPNEPPADPRSAISTLIHKFTSDLTRHVEGVPDDPHADEETGLGLIQSIGPVQEKFRRAIRETAPCFRPFERKYGALRHLGAATFLESEEEFKIDGEASDEEADVVVQPSTRPTFNFSSVPVVKLANSTHGSKGSKKIYIDDVMDRAVKARTRELPGHYPWVVQKTFIENIMKDWEAPALELCQSVYGILDRHVNTLISRHFSEFGQGQFEQRIRAIMHDHLQTCLERCQKQILWLLKLESRPFSLNTHYLEAYRTKFLVYYRSAREKYNQGDLAKHIKQHKQPALASTSQLPKRSTPAPTSVTTAAGTTIPYFSSNNSPFASLPANSFFSITPSVSASTTSTSTSTPTPTTTANPFGQHSISATPAPPPVSSSFTQTSSIPSTSPSNSTSSAMIAQVLAGLTGLGIEGLKADDLLKLLPSDPMEPALIIMADVRAYFQVAYKRFADNVPLAVDVELVQGAECDILPCIYAGLGINGPEGQKLCQELAMESPQVAERRLDLTNRLKRLQAAKLELLCIGF